MSQITYDKLEESKLWKLATGIAEFLYGQLGSLPEEEKWGMQSKLRQRAFDLTSDIAEAVGSIDPRDKAWGFGLARRSLFGIKNNLSLAHKTGILPIDPDIMVKIEAATDLLDTEIATARANIQAWYEEFDNKQDGGKK